MRALQRLRVPTLLFVNKIDRVGADPGSRDRSGAHASHTRRARRVRGVRLELTADLVAATAARPASDVLHSAATGAGIDALIDVITTYLPVAGTENDAARSGLVFKVERAAAGEKVAYVRMFDGSVRVRENGSTSRTAANTTITGLKVFEHGAAVDRPVVGTGQIAKLAGLRSVRTGDAIGSPPRRATQVFAPPMFEVAVVAHDVGQTAAMHAALVQLAEQDPMIGLRQDRERNETFVSLYGEVQQEVIQQTLTRRARHRGRLPRPDDDLHRAPARRRTRVRADGSADESVRRDRRPLRRAHRTRSGYLAHARCGARVDPALHLQDGRHVPRVDARLRVRRPRGPSGWGLPDFTVTVFECGYSSPTSNARDFRKLTEVVLAAAVRDAGTIICEPVQRFRIDAPESSLAGLLPRTGPRSSDTRTAHDRGQVADVAR